MPHDKAVIQGYNSCQQFIRTWIWTTYKNNTKQLLYLVQIYSAYIMCQSKWGTICISLINYTQAVRKLLLYRGAACDANEPKDSFQHLGKGAGAPGVWWCTQPIQEIAPGRWILQTLGKDRVHVPFPNGKGCHGSTCLIWPENSQVELECALKKMRLQLKIIWSTLNFLHPYARFDAQNILEFPRPWPCLWSSRSRYTILGHFLQPELMHLQEQSWSTVLLCLEQLDMITHFIKFYHNTLRILYTYEWRSKLVV